MLIVEDNVVNQKVLQRILQRLGYKPAVVANGAEAVAALEAQRYDIVFMDLQMPVMDGIEATVRARTLPNLLERHRSSLR
ncbi:MAG: response regulator [Anaerolineales bacterium]|nr:response regulator [Anaerolineales bacterium]